MSSNLPRIASRDEWLAARKALLAKEKEMTRARDALCAERRGLPMVEIDKPYVFAGPAGAASLIDLFEGRSQLIVGHFMFDPDWTDGCPSCSAGADEMSAGHLDHLHARDSTLAYVSDGDRVFHTYSMFARGAEQIGGSYYLLDLTAPGRQEDWEEPKGRAQTLRSATPGFDD